MSTMYYEIEIAYRREQMLRTRREAGSSRRKQRRQEERTRGLRPVPAPRLG